MNYYNVFVPEHYLYLMPLDAAIVLFFVETMLLNSAEVDNNNTIDIFVLSEVIYDGFPFTKENDGVLEYLIKNDYLCILDGTNEVTLGSRILEI